MANGMAFLQSWLWLALLVEAFKMHELPTNSRDSTTRLRSSKTTFSRELYISCASIHSNLAW